MSAPSSSLRPLDFVVWCVRGYQRLISRYMPPICRFHPSCSRYAVGALHEHGLLSGSLLAGWRILRCNPFHAGGDDPVPPRGAPWPRWQSERDS